MLIQNNPDKATLDKPISALAAFNSQTGVGALQAYRKMAEPPTAFWDDTMPNSVVAFTQEKVAMIFAPSWVISNVHAQNPDLDIKVAPVPKVPNSVSLSIANYWVEGVSKVSQNQLEAWKFIKFLSEKDNMVKLYANQTKTRIVGEPYSRVDLADQLAKSPYLSVVIQQAPQYVSLPLISRTNDNGLNDRIIDYLKNAVNATINGLGYQEAANIAQKGIDQILGQYKLQ
jgi:multiple sugar transport system substrate-binding protein